MAYDPYKSLLANATREHLKRSIDLNTHLVGNVFLPAIDSQFKKPSKSQASLKHLKVIEQCIMAENKREERLAKCATTKERRVISKKFQVQRERERELIQALMLGKYPERLQEIKLLETEVVSAKTPRQELNQEITGLTAKVATPDRVFRKTDVTGGVPKSKPHAHKKFTLPQCNGSPGKKGNAKAQAAAAANLSSPSTGVSLSERDTRVRESPMQKKPNPSRLTRSATIVRTPKSQVATFKETTTAAAEANATSPNQRAHSPCISPHRLQLKTRTTPQLTSLRSEPVEETSANEAIISDANNGDQQHKSSSVAFEGALSFSEAKQVAACSNLLKAKVSAETATQTTPRLQGNDQDSIKTSLSRPELPPVNPSLLADASVTTPRRPRSCQVVRSTRQAFLESLTTESTAAPDGKEVQLQSIDPAPIEAVDAESDTNEEPAEVGDNSPVSEGSTDYGNDAFDPADDGSAEAAQDDESVSLDDVDPDENADDDLETDVAEILFDIVDMVEAAVADEERQKALPSPRTVSPRPRSSMGRTTKYVLRIQSLYRGYRARIAFRLALYEDALSCGVLGAMPGTIQGRSGWYLDPKRLMAYYFSIPEPDGDWEQKYTLRCSRLVLTPYEMRDEVLSKVPALLQQCDEEEHQ